MSEHRKGSGSHRACSSLPLSQDLEKSASMSSRMKGAGGIGGEDGAEEERTRVNRPYPPGLQPGGESFSCLSYRLTSPSINYACEPLCQSVAKCNHQPAGSNLDF